MDLDGLALEDTEEDLLVLGDTERDGEELRLHDGLKDADGEFDSDELGDDDTELEADEDSDDSDGSGVTPVSVVVSHPPVA
jgi:hypothetical protein